MDTLFIPINHRTTSILNKYKQQTHDFQHLIFRNVPNYMATKQKCKEPELFISYSGIWFMVIRGRNQSTQAKQLNRQAHLQRYIVYLTGDRIFVSLSPFWWGNLLFLPCLSAHSSVPQLISQSLNPLVLLNRSSCNLFSIKDAIKRFAHYRKILWELCPFEIIIVQKYTTR